VGFDTRDPLPVLCPGSAAEPLPVPRAPSLAGPLNPKSRTAPDRYYVLAEFVKLLLNNRDANCSSPD
jgi:hypothetical protein